MPSELEAQIREGYERFNRAVRGEEGLEAYAKETYDPDIDVEMGWLEGTFRGHEGLAQLFEGQRAVLDDLRLDPEEIVEVGERLVVPLCLSGRGRETGIPVEYHVAHVITFREGRIVHIRLAASKEKAMEGLASSPPE